MYLLKYKLLNFTKRNFDDLNNPFISLKAKKNFVLFDPSSNENERLSSLSKLYVPCRTYIVLCRTYIIRTLSKEGLWIN